MKPIKTWDEADELLRNIIAVDCTIEAEQNLMKRECQEIKTRRGEYIKIYEAQKKDFLETLESYFIAHEDDSEVKGKTYEGPYAKCGLRLTPPAVKPLGRMTWERILTRILDLGWAKKYLRPLVHSIKDIDRELLASDKVDDTTRREIGVKLHQEERFWYEGK